MNLFNKLFTPIFLATTSLVAAPLASVAHAEVIITDEPPAPREEKVEVRPGFVYAHGNWERSGSKWNWRAGHYEKERSGHHWRDGHWEPRGHGRVWVEGSWD